MATIRAYRSDDLDALYRICLETGDAGQDATALYRDPKLVGHVYAAPYGVLFPESAFVVEDEVGVGGYVIGAADTAEFEARTEREWWPRLRAIYPDPPAPATPAEHMAHHIHHPERTPQHILEAYPAHLHIDLLPRFQGKGFGVRMMDVWMSRAAELGARAAHLGVGLRNARAVKFYRAYGFRDVELEDDGTCLVMGMATKRKSG